MLRENFAVENERENFQSLFRQTPEMVCILKGPEHVFEFVNPAHVKVLGFDATGKNVRAAQPESVEIHSILDHVYTSGETAHLREIPVTIGDRVRFFDLTYSARRDGNAQINGVMIIGREITEQVIMRETIKKQNDAFELALSNAPLKAVLTSLVKSLALTVGSTAKVSILIVDDVHKTLIVGAAPNLPPAFNSVVDGLKIGPNSGSCGTAAFRNETVYAADIPTDPLWDEFKESALEFDLLSCWSKPIFSSAGKLLGTFAIYNHPFIAATSFTQQMIDIVTNSAAVIIERQKQIEVREATERALMVSQEQLSMAVNVAKIGFFDWDIQKDHVVFSRQMKLVWGLEPEHSVYSLASTLKLIHPDDRERVSASINRTLTEGTPYNVEYRVAKTNGEIIWLEVSGTVIFDDTKRPVRFFGTSIDITERKNAEEVLRAAIKTAQSATQAKSAFLTNMSHEIRTPLGAIMGFTELVARPSTSLAELKSYVQVINRNSQQLLRIVDDILDLSKVEAGQMLSEVVEVALPDFLRDIYSLVKLRIKEKPIEFRLVINSPLPKKIMSDPIRLKQIVMNVLSNALKFTENGVIELQINLTLGNILSFVVKDSGCGISESQQKQIFRPFVQADASTSRKYGGTGLGLVLTKHLCTMLGGDFKLIQSQVGVGSTFEVTVRIGIPEPIEYFKATSSSRTIEKGQTGNETLGVLSGLNILVAEDSIDNQELMRLMLSRAGAKVQIASDGYEAVEKAENGEFSAILMDIQMPHMDGHEATRILRDNGYEGRIIALTAHAMKEEREKCSHSGFTGYLSKPVQWPVLFRTLANQGHV